MNKDMKCWKYIFEENKFTYYLVIISEMTVQRQTAAPCTLLIIVSFCCILCVFCVRLFAWQIASSLEIYWIHWTKSLCSRMIWRYFFPIMDCELTNYFIGYLYVNLIIIIVFCGIVVEKDIWKGSLIWN